MKYRSNETQLKETNKVQQRKKRLYEKPQLGKVTLFADQVLGVCRAPRTPSRL